MNVVCCCLGAEPADGTRPPVDETKSTTNAVVRQISPDLFQLGVVTLNKQNHTVSFPAVVNMHEGVVEYAVVTSGGKIHESIFRTDAQPSHIHLAMLLLDAKPANTNAFPADLTVPPPGERVMVEVNWKRQGRQVTKALEECAVSAAGSRPLARGPWVYNGSWVANGQFIADAEGSIVAFQIDPLALVNNPRPGREDDTFHHCNASVLPPAESPVEITFRLSQVSGEKPSEGRQPKPANGERRP